MNKIDRIKKAMGIESANCESCQHLGHDSAGSDDPCEPSWPVCNLNYRYNNLKSFPFKKDMRCWVPNFWHSKFPDIIKNGTDKEFKKARDAFRRAYEMSIN